MKIAIYCSEIISGTEPIHTRLLIKDHKKKPPQRYLLVYRSGLQTDAIQAAKKWLTNLDLDFSFNDLIHLTDSINETGEGGSGSV